MKKHLTIDEIMDLVTSGKAINGNLRMHLKECGACRDVYSFLRKVFTPFDNSSQIPDDVIRKNILSSYNKIVESKNRRPIYNIIKKAIYVITLVSIISSVAVSGYLLYKKNSLENRLFIADMSGDVKIDGKLPDKNKNVEKNKTIVTAEASSCSLYFSDNILIHLKEQTGFLFKDIYNKDGLRNYYFVLINGKADVTFTPGAGKFSYMFLTPNSEIHCTAARYLLETDGVNTVLSLNEGGAKIVSTESGKSIDAKTGFRYYISGEIVESSMSTSITENIPSVIPVAETKTVTPKNSVNTSKKITPKKTTTKKKTVKKKTVKKTVPVKKKLN